MSVHYLVGLVRLSGVYIRCREEHGPDCPLTQFHKVGFYPILQSTSFTRIFELSDIVLRNDKMGLSFLQKMYQMKAYVFLYYKDISFSYFSSLYQLLIMRQLSIVTGDTSSPWCPY